MKFRRLSLWSKETPKLFLRKALYYIPEVFSFKIL